MRWRSISSRTMRVTLAFVLAAGVLAGGFVTRLAGQVANPGWKVIAWNNLGMHCLDADFSVASILPPYNTIQAHVVDSSGRLVTDPTSVRLTYEGVADPSGSINVTSSGKTNFWQFVSALFGASLPVDTGLLNNNMPGAPNVPKPMTYDPAVKWFIAEGIPITPYDDAGAKNYYPLMRVTARDTFGNVLASTDIVLPVSDEMDCSLCHRSGADDAARPIAGWAVDPNPQRDFRLNLLRLHDERQLGNPTYASALAAHGYTSAGLYASATGGRPTLCAHCHASEALPGSGYPGIPPLTQSVHALHATVTDPTNGLPLDSVDNRSACYRCHPGSETRCLRGVMGNAVAADGSMAIQCQNCHGKMSAVGAPTRTGWLDEPTCQNCHTGTAMVNSGAIRFTSVFDATGQPRVAADRTFATSDNTPAPGLSLYRFSAGHGGLQCSACHGSTHAEYPSSHDNDNLQAMALQGHGGTISECAACHSTVPSTTTGGPHGMHPVGPSWVTRHHDVVEHGAAQCRTCHGSDYRGTVLSRTFSERTLNTKDGTRLFFKGSQIGCYTCHRGPNSSDTNSNRAPVASDLSVTTAAGTPVTVTLNATDADGNALTMRIVSQPASGTVSLSGQTATYFPPPGFTGTERFTWAAWDGSIDSNLATVTVSVVSCTVSATASAPTSATVGVPVPFTATATVSGCSGPVAYDWNFGDGSAHSTAQNPSHTYAATGTFTWTLTAGVGSVTAVRTGSITVNAPPPTITSVRSRNGPFRIEINGSGFHQAAHVYIGSDTQPWTTTQWVSAQRLVLSGDGLLAKFPRRVRVTLKVVNPDGQFATAIFTR